VADRTNCLSSNLIGPEKDTFSSQTLWYFLISAKKSTSTISTGVNP